jgi:hypothetical protein
MLTRVQLQQILIEEPYKLMQLMKNFKQVHTKYSGGGLIEIEGICTWEKDYYTVKTYTKYVNDKVNYYIELAGAMHILTYNEYMFLTHYMIKCSEVSNFVELHKEEQAEQSKPWWIRIFS